MKRFGWAVALAAGTLLLLALLAQEGLRISNSRTHQLFGDLVTSVETSDSIVALTFDDGPVPIYTDSVLAMLNGLQVPATFFMVGSGIRKHPEIAKRVVAQGSELGNHSLNHRRLVLKTPSYVRHEIEATDTLMRAAGQAGDIFFRPPFGKRLVVLPLYLARHHRPAVLWSLEPDTYHSQADGMVTYVTQNVRPGSIVLLHVEAAGRSQGRLALPRIVAELRAAGYRFVTLSELMASGRPSPGAT